MTRRHTFARDTETLGPRAAVVAALQDTNAAALAADPDVQRSARNLGRTHEADHHETYDTALGDAMWEASK